MTSLNIGEINKLHAGPPEIPTEVRQQHQLFQGKREAINKLNRSIQGREEVELVELLEVFHCFVFSRADVTVGTSV